jgi:uncharacterized membrane protein
VPWRRHARAVDVLDVGELLGVIVVIDADLDVLERVVRRRRAQVHMAAVDQVGRARDELGDRAADVARLVLDGRAAPARPAVVSEKSPPNAMTVGQRPATRTAGAQPAMASVTRTALSTKAASQRARGWVDFETRAHLE